MDQHEQKGFRECFAKAAGQMSEALLKHLRTELGKPEIAYDTPPKPLVGGHEAFIYQFTLTGIPELPRRLVLRLYPPFYSGVRVVMESRVQTQLSQAGYPAPRVYAACTDNDVLGGPFFLMEHVSGIDLSWEDPDRVATILASAHADLHHLDPAKIMGREAFAESALRFSGRLAWIGAWIKHLAWLRPVMEWLIAKNREESANLVICHGDFHPLNVLVENGRVTAVLDWPGFILAEPELDVAYTLFSLRISLPYLFPRIDGVRIASGYLDDYRRRRSLDEERLAFYQVARCASAFVNAAEGQKIWCRTDLVAALVNLIEGLSGIRLKVPSL